MFYIDKNVIDRDTRIRIPLNTNDVLKLFKDESYVLYAWTDNKEIKNDFLHMRSDNFICKKHNLSYEEYNQIFSELSMFELNYILYKNYKNEVSIPSTEFERDACKMYWMDVIDCDIFTYLPLEVIASLNTKYYNAVTKLGLYSLISVSSDEYYCMTDWKFGEDSELYISEEIYKKDKTVIIDFTIYGKELNILLKYFKSTFKICDNRNDTLH